MVNTRMDNISKYNQGFINAFDIEDKIIGEELKYESIPEWDSIDHMTLIAELEDSFEISNGDG